MLKLKNICIKNGVVIMDVYPEGQEEQKFSMGVDISTKEISFCSRNDTVIFPAHARQYIEKQLNAGKPLPKEATVMWC